MRTEAFSLQTKKAAYIALFFVVAGISVSISLFEITSSLFMLLALTSFLTSGRRMRWREPWALLALLYFFTVAISVTQSETPYNSIRGLFRVFRCLLLAFSVMYVIDGEKKFIPIFQFLMIVSFLVGMDALFQGLSGRELLRGRVTTAYTQQNPRWTGPFHHANDFGGYLSLVIFPFICMTLANLKVFSIKKRLFFLAGLALLTLCLIQTYSRGAWVAMAGGIVAFVIHRRNARLTTLVALTSLLLFIGSPSIIQARALSLVDMKNGTIVERKELWSEAVRMIRAKPILGHGINTYASVEPRFKSGRYFDNQYAHNGYLQMAAETGLGGLVTFISLVGYFLVVGLKIFSTDQKSSLSAAGTSLIFGVFSFLLHSATDTNLHSVLLINLLWLAMGLGWSAVSLADKKKSIFA